MGPAREVLVFPVRLIIDGDVVVSVDPDEVELFVLAAESGRAVSFKRSPRFPLYKTTQIKLSFFQHPHNH